MSALEINMVEEGNYTRLTKPFNHPYETFQPLIQPGIDRQAGLSRVRVRFDFRPLDRDSVRSPVFKV